MWACVILFRGHVLELAAATDQRKISPACREGIQSLSTQEHIVEFSARMRNFSAHLRRPEFAGRSPLEALNQFGSFLQKNPAVAQQFHKDFNGMMNSLDSLKSKPMSQPEAKALFAFVLDQMVLSKNFVFSYFAIQASEKLLQDRTVIVSSKYYNAEDADVLIFSALNSALKVIRKDEDDDDPKRAARVSTSDLADKMLESLEENSLHPDSLFGGVQMARKMFSSDPEMKQQAEIWLREKTQRAGRLREVFRQKWLTPTF